MLTYEWLIQTRGKQWITHHFHCYINENISFWNLLYKYFTQKKLCWYYKFIQEECTWSFSTWTFVPKQLISNRALPNDIKCNFSNIMDAILASVNTHNLSLLPRNRRNRESSCAHMGLCVCISSHTLNFGSEMQFINTSFSQNSIVGSFTIKNNLILPVKHEQVTSDLYS